jgi:hypothetical protein
MKKRILSLVLVLLFGFFLASCEEEVVVPTEFVLTSITINGATDITLAFETPFNVYTGVTAIGNDLVDYTDDITIVSTATISATGDLDTTKTGTVLVRYEVRVGELLAQRNRYITVTPPQAVEGEMLINPDFANGTAGWDDAANGFYNADGSSLVLSTEEGALKAEVVSGANVYTPRFGQQNVPFEQGKTYEVSFDAKSSVVKTINLQVGELLSVSPWFQDFKPGITIHQEIGTVWANYSYKFTMALDNQRGGILFELGTIGGIDLDATMWFDNMLIEESTPDVDTLAPVLSGVSATATILVDGTFDPMAGVTAFDATDGDLTDAIVVVITDEDDLVVTTLDTSFAAVYTVTYTVEDALGNEATAVLTLEVVGMLFNTVNQFVNPSFTAAFDTTTPEWGIWQQDWGTAPVIVPTLDIVAGTYTLDITGGGDASWAIQLFQNQLVTLVEGTTYKVSMTASAEVARSVNVALGYGSPWIEYARESAIALTTEMATYEFVFTSVLPTHLVNLTVELGTQAGFADGEVVFYDFSIVEAILDETITNSDFDNTGWTLWSQNWGAAPTVTSAIVDGAFTVTTDLPGEAGWAIQFNQAGLTLENGKSYILSFDAKASVARDINVALFIPNVWTSYLRHDAHMLTTEMVTYSFPFTVTAATSSLVTLTFEMGATPAFAASTVTIDNVSLKEDVANAPEKITNGNATTVVDFTFWTENASTDSMTLVDGEAVIVVGTLGGAAYTPHFFQMIAGLVPGNYTLKLVMTSTVARDFRFNLVLPDSGYASLLPDTKYDFNVEANVEEVIYVNFTVTNSVTNVKFELDFGTLGGTLISLPGTFTISEILLYQNFN